MFQIHSILCCILMIAHVALAGTWITVDDWSECSKTCDGGLSSRKRVCYGSNCTGNSVLYKFCNTQGCTTDSMTDHEACKSLNKRKFKGSLFQWVSRQTYQCSVFCAEETNRIPDLVSVNLPDGTKCSKTPNKYCISGTCSRLGCDGLVGSEKTLDECGICGGNGSNCKSDNSNGDKSGYRWEVQWTPCSVSCGTGFQSSQMKCRKIRYNRIVPDFFCDQFSRPQDSTRECSLALCDPHWKMSSWGSCSVGCGGGIQKRKVSCLQMSGRSKTDEIPAYRCPDPIPPSKRPCNTQFCPSMWRTGQWKECSVTCGVGTQRRPVYCMKSFVRGMHVNVSDGECMGPKPPESRPCSNLPCFQMQSFSPHIKIDNSTFIQLKKSKTIRLRVGARAVLLPKQPVKVECPVKNFDKSLLFWSKNNRMIPRSVFNRVYVTSKGALKIRRTDPSQDAGIYTCIAGMETGTVIIEFQSKKLAKLKAKKIKTKLQNKTLNEVLNKPQADVVPGSGPQNIIVLPVSKPHSSKAVYLTSDWSKCSRTCGIGFQTRKVTCNIVTEKYVKIVTDDNCKEKIPEHHRVCEDNPHCPVWRTGPWSVCSPNKCIYEGLAMQTRKVFCGSQSNETVILPIKRCDGNTRPVSLRQCANERCVAIWKTSKWTPCKPRCAKTGKKTRILSCVWKYNKRPAKDNCKAKPKPEVRKLCKPKYCKKDCYDSSRYCSITRLLRMCRYRTFRDKCCATCSNAVLT